MRELLDALLAPAADRTPGDIAALALPESYRAVVLRAEDTAMFDGIPSRDKDPRKSLHVDEVPVPELGPGEALVAVMASSVNYNS
ncbi:crotonyl-CoA carboxylase/reductase, partial [Streptomyces sp. NPDC006324]